ncbi:MAG: Mu transposase C-terminal domain-containing protein, partial [Hungatella sp.]
EELNRYWRVYLEEAYQNYRHDGIAEYYESLNAPVPPEGISPVQEWNRDTRNLTYLDTSVVTEAFLHHESRCVDKGACISFRGRRYEIKPSLIGFKVEIAYDPKNPEILTVHHKGVEPFTARPVKIGSYCDKNPTLPISVQPELPESSRFLNALERKHEQSRKQVANAISFSTYGREGKANV